MGWIEIDRRLCREDGICVTVCPYGLLARESDGSVRPVAESAGLCIECGHCLAVCPHGALFLNGMGQGDCDPAVPAGTLSRETVASLLKGRRSIREFRDEPVGRETIEWLLDVARWAPSACNRQPVNWKVVEGRDRLRTLAQLVVEWMRAEMLEPDVVEACARGTDRIFRGAPQLLVAHALETEIDPGVDCAIATATVELAAHATGVGACWAGYFTTACKAYAPLREALTLPAGHEVFAALMLGLPLRRYLVIPSRHAAQIRWVGDDRQHG